MYTVLIVFYVLIAVTLIGLVLIQHGKGADAGAAFGSGASGTVFGARGSSNFLTTSTAWLAAAFFALSLVLAYFLQPRATVPHSVVDTAPPAPAAKVELPTLVQVPATPKTDAAPAAAAAPAGPAANGAKPSAAAPPAAAPAQAQKNAPAPAKPATPKVPE
ncbi:MAG: preprotein translocase subunit SecG [Nevskia sp.]|nr:preprotein translocase subunit SecG [Nevskia sp.]